MFSRGAMRNFLTSRHNKYWSGRKIDWKAAYWNLDHPHRDLIIKTLKGIRFGSIIEVGCGAGANLGKILQNFKGVQVGGIDVSQDAINTALELFGNDAEVLEVSNATKIFLSDKSADVVLTDMALIYLDPFNINKALKEIKRVARKNVVLVEFHHTNWFKRLVLRLFGGYNSYNYEKLLKKHGFYDIDFYKLTEKDWPSGEPQKTFGYIISAKV